ncbi:MAG: four helix bundle protein [Bacteroidetes bacterium HGW-Bacteroidetes-4]|jgi:four helix bundle protein|nr:MAG: four helix bundle protein [Bacteroidetes bacterium HGW-Bacteroidetes-4]
MSERYFYDLEERTLKFAIDIRQFIKKLPKTIANNEDSKQLVRSSGSIGANYVEANESLGTKDKLMRKKISRKECKESVFWLKCINESNELNNSVEANLLINEDTELLKIFSSIIEKLKD